MKRKIKLIIAGILACICHLPTLAQSGKLFNTDNQLSSNLATQVYQDTNGLSGLPPAMDSTFTMATTSVS